MVKLALCLQCCQPSSALIAEHQGNRRTACGRLGASPEESRRVPAQPARCEEAVPPVRRHRSISTPGRWRRGCAAVALIFAQMWRHAEPVRSPSGAQSGALRTSRRCPTDGLGAVTAVEAECLQGDLRFESDRKNAAVTLIAEPALRNAALRTELTELRRLDISIVSCRGCLYSI